LRSSAASKSAIEASIQATAWQKVHAASRTLRAERISGGYVVRDANGQALAYIYSRENALPSPDGHSSPHLRPPEILRKAIVIRDAWEPA
jgi:hypothetical protein